MSLGTSRTPAARMIGVASKNENLAAISALKPDASPPTTVTPDREMPGMRARTWEVPTPPACHNVSLLSSDLSLGRLKRSPKSRSAPFMIKKDGCNNRTGEVGCQAPLENEPYETS